MREKILITGGAGFIGSHTADALVKKGHTIVILDKLIPPVHTGRWPSYLSKKYALIRGDVRHAPDLLRALKGVSYVYHLAAYQDQRLDFSTFFETNTVSTALLYELIVQHHLPVKKVILASSQFVYGDGVYRCQHGRHEGFRPELRTLQQMQKGQWDIRCSHGKPARHVPFREDQPVSPTNSYGLSKYALENLALRLGKTYGIPTTALRYSIVQGPRQSPRNLYSGALRIFVSQALAGVPITVYEDGRGTRDFVNINDVVSANLLALMNRKTNYEIFNVGGGKAHAVLQFAKRVKQLTNSASPILVGAFRRTDTRHAVSDISKLKKLRWEPRFTIDDSIRAYAEWFKKEGFLKVIDKKGLLKLREGIRS